MNAITIRTFWKERQVSTSSLATRVSMRCAFDVQRTSGMQSTSANVSQIVFKHNMWIIGRRNVSDGPRCGQQTCAVLLLPSSPYSLPFIPLPSLPPYPCTASPNFRFPVLTLSCPTLQSGLLWQKLDWKPWLLWTGIRSFSSHFALAQQFFLSFLCYLFGVPGYILLIEFDSSSEQNKIAEAVSSTVLETMDMC